MAGGPGRLLRGGAGCACPGWCCSWASGWRSARTATGWIHFSDYELARTIGIVALALILFEGGLTAGFGEIRSVSAPRSGWRSLGRSLTAMIAGLAAWWIFDLSLLEGLLLGSIVAATDGAAIFALLRGSTLRRRVALTLEGESGLNDPLAVLLVIGFIDWIQTPEYGVLDMALLLLRELGIGLAVGLAVGWLAIEGLRRVRLGAEAAYPIATLSMAAIAYGGAAALHGSGFLAVYLVGLALGSRPIPGKRAVTVFHQGLAGLAQVTMFLVLGLLVFPSQLWGSHSREPCSPWSSSSSPARWRRSWRRPGVRSTPASGLSFPGAASGAPFPSCLRPFP